MTKRLPFAMTRTERITIRGTPGDRERLELLAGEAKLTESEYLRSLLDKAYAEFDAARTATPTAPHRQA